MPSSRNFKATSVSFLIIPTVCSVLRISTKRHTKVWPRHHCGDVDTLQLDHHLHGWSATQEITATLLILAAEPRCTRLSTWPAAEACRLWLALSAKALSLYFVIKTGSARPQRLRPWLVDYRHADNSKHPLDIPKSVSLQPRTDADAAISSSLGRLTIMRYNTS